MKFDYYYGSQADQFSFIRIPRVLLTEKMFEDLTLQSKMLYSILLDRMTLSMKNGWFDDENRAYIIYPISEIMSDLGFSKKKAMDYLAELQLFGLVEKKKRGFGLPSIIYVKSFMIQKNYARGTETGTSEKKQTGSRSTDFGTTVVLESDPGGTETGTTEVPETIPLKNKTKENYIDMSQIKSNHILSAQADDAMGSDDDAIIKAYEELIRDNIEFDSLLISHPYDREMIEGIVDLILETIVSKSDPILIASERYPASLVKSKLLKLNYMHIEYVLDCFKGNTTKVKNIKKYLLAALFNASTTMDGYYKAEVNHDMPQFAG